MSKKITYYTRIYEPEREAISKQVKLLNNQFNGKIICMHSLDSIKSLFKIIINKKLISFCYNIVPLRIIPRILAKKSDIIHIIGNVNNNYYLNNIKHENIILTLTTQEDVNPKQIDKLKYLVVETEKQQKEILRKTNDRNKIKVIEPGINRDNLYYKKASGRFKIGFASSPISQSYFEKKGICTLLKVAKEMNQIEFHFFWRGRTTSKIKNLVKDMNLKNVKIIDQTLDTGQIYENTHATIAVFTTYDENKTVPNSIIESIICQKPVLVSNKVGLSDEVKKNKFGIVFKHDKDSIIRAIKELKRNYNLYQTNCKKISNRYSIEKNISLYSELYNEL